ncbi:g11495 [Coccomyxa viridis]|uniref:G11495 protein n=1 Tax=Coccomyxa viridis TaxID=1274662 RepID=A0ABP1G825_9CHLO
MRMFGNFVGEAPQRIIICGENPSEWDRATQSQFKSRPWKGPSNKLWPILLKEGIITAKADEGSEQEMLDEIGFVDIGLAEWGLASTQAQGNFRKPGSKNNPAWFREYKPGFFARLAEHMQRASDTIMCTCGECGAPAFLVFNSKTTYEKLLALDRMKVEGGIKCGLQTVKPKDWPLPETTKVYVMPSTSGLNRYFEDDGGFAVWKALSEDMRAYFENRAWPFKPKCYPCREDNLARQCRVVVKGGRKRSLSRLGRRSQAALTDTDLQTVH